MKRADLFDLAARNLREALLRNSLTTLGIAVGVASLVAMLSLGVGLQNLADDRLNRSGIFDTVVVYSRRDIPSFNRAERRSMGPTGDARRLDLAARREMEALPDVTEVYPEVRFAIEARFGQQSNFATVAGLPPSARANDAFDDLLGSFFSSPDADEAILHLDFARELAGLPRSGGFTPPESSSRGGGFTPPESSSRGGVPTPPESSAGGDGATPPASEKGVPVNAPPEVAALLGQSLTLRYAERVPLAAADASPSARRGGFTPPASSGTNATTSPSSTSSTSDSSDDYGFSVLRREKPMRIVGIVTQEPFGGMRSFARGRLFIPIAVAEKLNVLQTSALRDAIRSDASETVYTSLLVRVSNPVRVAAVQDAIKQMGFTTWSMLDAARNLRVVFAIFDTFLGAFGSLALAVASLGIVNTLVMAILERRREIGIMKALGASDRDIKQIFFTEAAAMGLAGGALGVLLGWAIGQLINFGVALWLQRQDLPPQQIWATPLWLVASAIAFSVIVSLIAGLYPAARAAKLDPVQALRYE